MPTLPTALPVPGLLLLTLNMGEVKYLFLFYLFSWTSAIFVCVNMSFSIPGQMAILDRLGEDGFHWQGWHGWN